MYFRYTSTVKESTFYFIQIFIMIDLIQWRVCIGMWCGHSVQRKSRLINHESETLGMCTHILRTLLSHTSVRLYTLTVCIFLQLILSGDVELNPGPVG